MPRVAKRPPIVEDQARVAHARMMASASVVDRPSQRDMLMRRARRMMRPAIGAGGIIIIIFVASMVLRGTDQGGSVSGVRTVLGGIGSVMGLNVRNIIIDGRENTPEPLLRHALGVMIGQPMLGFSLNDARGRLLSLGWVADAVVERRLPDTLVVRLIERAPFAVWQDHGQFRLIDRNGETMGEQDVGRASQELDLPLVVGPGAPEATTELFDEMKPYPDIRSRMVGAVRVGQERWNLVLKSGATVMLPGEDQDAALGRLQALQTRMQLLDRPVKVVDLRLADRVVVRPEPAPDTGASGKDASKSGNDAGTTNKHP
ncbi:cell division protein FtsQ/DivIB [Acidisoma cellulosilytica]|uniref:Cell division protein FtsQ n=1 Tax=Acidisoma cellulosilyticum TaxID=2802395 RepID=A0A963YX33_9PROT|nr:cell division protein FtsQ/DivIB [Acidisoma cellulosilyticum]MCB8878797.1 cell division protein FtsQ/DivIB [Acidisoma cellulosilyticum]